MTKAEIAAQEYLFGKNAGDWKYAWMKAGFQKAPSLSESSIRKAMEAAGARRKELKEEELQNEFDKALSVFQQDEDWKKLADAVMPLYIAIAQGEFKSKPGQLKAIENILLRGYGKITALQEDTSEVGVVVLPTQGDGAEMHICEDCMHVCPDCMKIKEKKAESSLASESRTTDSVSKLNG